jgi:TPR repeat protein
VRVLALLILLLPAAASAQKGDEGGADPDDFEVLASPFQALEDACVVDGDGDACLRAGRLWRTGQGETRPDREQAINLLAAGCRFGSIDACTTAADMYLRMEAGLRLLADGTVQLDMGSAADYFRAACEGGRLSACGLWGDLLYDPRSLLPNKDAGAYGLDQDVLLARQAWADGCNGGDIEGVKPLPPEGEALAADLRSCARLADIHRGGGLGGRKDPRRQLYFLQRACRIEGGDAFCAQADALVAAGTEPEEAEPLPPPPDGGRDFNAGVNEPDADRFADPALGIRSREAGDRPHRVEFELGVGPRVVYPTTVQGVVAGVQWRLGFNLWFHLFGVSLEGGVLTNDPFNARTRTYTRMMNTVSFKLALPLDVPMPLAARAWFVIGVGPQLGALQLLDHPFELTWGAREMVQFVLSSPQERGPRQWGAVRIEQQQSGWQTGNGEIEHSTQLMFLFGFTAGGWGPAWHKVAVKKRDPLTRPRRRLTPELLDRPGG